MNRRRNPRVAGIVPSHWNVTIKTEKDIIFLGSLMIRLLIQTWRRTGKTLSSRIKPVDRRIRSIHNRRIRAAKRERMIHLLILDKSAVDAKIRLLVALEKRAEKKPFFPGLRSSEWFHLEDSVVCYIRNVTERILTNDFVAAQVINGYMHHEGRVSVQFDARVHHEQWLDGRGFRFGVSRPEIMHEWEFEYLLTHPDFAALWANEGASSSSLEAYDADQFLASLAREAERRSVGRQVKRKR